MMDLEGKGSQGKIGGLGGGGKSPQGVTKDMLKPLLFGNHQFHFKLFSAVVCLGKIDNVHPFLCFLIFSFPQSWVTIWSLSMTLVQSVMSLRGYVLFL